jgi:CHAT domain-containing protein
MINLFRPSYLHISCHGLFNKNQPLESCLLLSTTGLTDASERAWRDWQVDLLWFLKQHPCATEADFDRDPPSSYNGGLRASYFRLLKLEGTEFVFLSACSAGSVSDYDEIEGFAQSVFLAGCPNLIAPLRPVTTQAALVFVREFYSAYKNQTMGGEPSIGRIGRCVAIARKMLLDGGYNAREAAAWTVWGLG